MPNPIETDPLLFDSALFKKRLQQGHDQLELFKNALTKANRRLQECYESGENTEILVNKRSWFIDQLLQNYWCFTLRPDDATLIAVGGYGRGELHPYSDIDLMILCGNRYKKKMHEKIQSFLTLLWDIGLEVGHSVRTVGDCRSEAKRDITVITNLIESRFICGNKKLFDRMIDTITPTKMWPTSDFFEVKLDEQAARHKKLADTTHSVEPNIKECPGGLRDIQTIAWVVKRHFGASRLRDLIKNNFLTDEEYCTLRQGRNFLWRIRYGLHISTGRREDRLLFEYQKNIARQFGFSRKGNAGVEKFMKMYYTTVREIDRLNEMLLQHLQEIIFFSSHTEKIHPINHNFRIRNNFIEVTDEDVFFKSPLALLEMFLLIQQNPAIKGVRAGTIRHIKKHAELIDTQFRQDARARHYFLEIIRQPRRVGHELRRLHRYGVLGAYLPVFDKIQGLMQFDLFHSYTVDEHILFVIRNMRLFALDEYKKKYPLYYEVNKKIPKKEVLYIAGLFHDIAKGRPNKDHSKQGAKEAALFCKEHGLSAYDSKLIAWLVEHHLLMSRTSQKEDINDPDVIKKFSDTVLDQNCLNHLYLLTVADICATNPGLWNSWKASLLSDLYHSTLLLMQRGMERPLHKKQRLQQIKREALALIADAKQNEIVIHRLWRRLNSDYFLQHTPKEVAWHTMAMLKTNNNRLPLIIINQETEKGWSQLFIYTKYTAGVFSATTRAIEQLRLNILDARLITTKGAYTLNSYVILEADGNPVKDGIRCAEIIAKISDALKSPHQLKPFKRPNLLENRKLKSFKIPTRVSFSKDEKNNRTIMEVITMDKPGVLSRIGVAMELCNTRLQGAKISTYGERAEDIFYITDQQNKPLSNPLKYECLKSSIIEALT